MDSAPLRVCLNRKVQHRKMVNIDKIIIYLNSRHLTHNEEQRTFIQKVLDEENMPFFEAITDYLKTLSKSMKERENMSPKNKTLIGGWISIAPKV